MTRNLLNPKTTQTLGLILKKIQTLVFEYKKAFRVKGRMAARIVDPFVHWPPVLSIGLRLDPTRNDNEDRFTDKSVLLSSLKEKNRENEDYRIFKALEALLIPNIREELMRQGPDAAVKLGKLVMPCLPILSSPPSLSFLQLNEGSKGAHALDVNSLKIALARWNPHWVPPYNSKHEVRDGIPPWRSFVMATGFPNQKIISEDPDLNDLMSGFLRGDTLLRGFNHVFISLSTALNDAGTDKSTGKGTAAQHNVSEVTLESIIYVAHIVTNTFQAKGGNGLFAYRKYFKFLQRSVREWPEADQENLLTWWNEKVFSQMNDAKPAKRADGSLSIAERMAAQAANARRATGSH
ncbi:hypothetical protein R3P38DRAFT_2804233 [Favolaschia claudopus]|uniref:Uncharacterized protein n=1 Tax=Favolaschia claudopus TaxID=2862362 RepID=A0AAV9ZRJ0_9AGAR